MLQHVVGRGQWAVGLRVAARSFSSVSGRRPWLPAEDSLRTAQTGVSSVLSPHTNRHIGGGGHRRRRGMRLPSVCECVRNRPAQALTSVCACARISSMQSTSAHLCLHLGFLSGASGRKPIGVQIPASPHHSTRSPANPARSLMAGHVFLRREWCLRASAASRGAPTFACLHLDASFGWQAR